MAVISRGVSVVWQMRRPSPWQLHLRWCSLCCQPGAQRSFQLELQQKNTCPPPLSHVCTAPRESCARGPAHPEPPPRPTTARPATAQHACKGVQSCGRGARHCLFGGEEGVMCRRPWRCMVAGPDSGLAHCIMHGASVSKHASSACSSGEGPAGGSCLSAHAGSPAAVHCAWLEARWQPCTKRRPRVECCLAPHERRHIPATQ